MQVVVEGGYHTTVGGVVESRVSANSYRVVHGVTTSSIAESVQSL